MLKKISVCYCYIKIGKNNRLLTETDLMGGPSPMPIQAGWFCARRNKQIIWMVMSMEDIKVFESVIDDMIRNKIKDAYWCADLMQYAAYKCKIDGLIASAYLFCPQIIQIKDYIFIKQFWNHSIEDSMNYISILEKQYHYDKKSIEMSVNTWSLGDFFVGDPGELMDDDEIMIQFGNAVVYFWKNRVEKLFPDRKIIVELGEELMGELGICVTMYEEY